ncbi:hypothetical protein M0R04_14760 [Candidatus Dojkabacteria bacterium]|jgi:hypothetical protein|nr:hypothetical protein [Candidatus Dojkabacteria bacterium]
MRRADVEKMHDIIMKTKITPIDLEWMAAVIDQEIANKKRTKITYKLKRRANANKRRH